MQQLAVAEVMLCDGVVLLMLQVCRCVHDADGRQRQAGRLQAHIWRQDSGGVQAGHDAHEGRC